MSSIVVAGDTSGSVTLQAPAVAGSTVLTLPASTGTVLTQNSSAPANSLVVDASGNVGIGTSSPSAPLDIKVGTGNFTVGLQGVANAQLTASGTLRFNTTGGTTVFSQNTIESVRIDSSGNVGIGTSSPGAILHTSKTSVAAATVGAFIQNSDNTVGTEVRLGFAANTNLLSQERYGWIGYVNRKS